MSGITEMDVLEAISKSQKWCVDFSDDQRGKTQYIVALAVNLLLMSDVSVHEVAAHLAGVIAGVASLSKKPETVQ